MSGSNEIKEDYTSSLADLTFNSKPLISVLTILAEENVAHAREIVEAIEEHLSRVRTEVKLPVLYLIDCIIKNVGGPYTALFCQNIVSTFCSVFEKVDERTRSEMFRLRQTWSDVIPQKKLYALDVQIKQLDPAWPLIAPPPPIGIHLNPKFFMNATSTPEGALPSAPVVTNVQTKLNNSVPNVNIESDPKTLSMQQKIINKQRELLELQQRKVQLELLQTQVKLQEQLKSTQVPTTSANTTVHSRNLLLKPEVAKQLVAPNVSTKTGSSKSRSGTHGRNTTRVAPVQNNLLNARPVRDPRLLRQLQQQQQAVSEHPSQHTINSDVHVDTKSKSEPQVIESNTNKIVNNKANIRNEHVEHRLVDNNKDDVNEAERLMDTDLRQTSTGKKRLSADNCGSSPAKKTKSEVFDVLFGSEDTDLRQKPPVDFRPLTPPPPPIISDKDIEMPDAIEITDTKQPDPPIKNFNLDALRAKLANAVQHDKLKESEELKASVQNRSPSSKQSSRESMSNTQIIISPADEMGIKEGTMTNAQKTALMSKILAQMETQQLREAQRRESETFSTSFQPISDDELEATFSDDPSDEDSQKLNNTFRNNEWPTIKDDRPPELPSFGNLQNDQSLFQRNLDYRDASRGRNWRNARQRQKQWDVGPPSRVGARPNFRPLPDPWLRPLRPALQTNSNVFVPAPSVEIPPLVISHPDTYQFITIDSEPREVRYYDDIALAFLSNGNPREISFHNGSRRIFFDNEPYMLHFNSPYEEILIKGNKHMVRFGAPSREIIIDGNGYQCYFDQKEKLIELDGNAIVVKLEPPPPQVKIGEKRLDLVAGKTQLVVDAKNMFTVFLDGKVQTFKIDDVEHTLKFVDRLKAAIIDDVRHEIEFGGLPKSIMLKDRKYFIRFSVLPKGIRPGLVRVKDMEVTQMYRSPVHEIEDTSLDSKPQPIKIDSPERTNSPGQFEMHQQTCDNLDMLSSVMASAMIPTEREGGSYSIEHTTPSESQEFVPSIPSFKPDVKELTVPAVLNINDLFQKLVATGIVATAGTTCTQESETQPTKKPKIRDFKNLEYQHQDFIPHDFKSHDFKSRSFKTQDFKPPSFNKPDTLKVRRSGAIDLLYVGQQCSSCGVRFPHRLDNYYKQHLDWHFRQNRKSRKSNRLSACRRWYYLCSDWKNYEEIEDLEERGKSFFENQAGSGNNEPEEEDVEIPCISANPDVTDPVCEVCLERLEQFYNEEKEEWQLRMAMRVDDKIYHPLCYDDYQASLVEVTLNTDIQEIPGLDGVDEAPSPEPNDIDDVMEVIDNIDDEIEATPPTGTEVATDEHTYKILEENNLIDDDSDADDDVIIHEVVPERIIVDDDKEDDYIPPSEPLIMPAIIIKEEPIDDGFFDIEDSLLKPKMDIVKIKTEPVDDSENNKEVESIPNEDIEPKPAAGDTTQIEVVSSMDGNFELDSLDSESPSSVPSNTIAGKIKINITKPIPTVISKEIHESINDSLNPIHIDPDQPLPPGEEPVQLNIKPTLQGMQLKRNPVVKRGSELTGLCSIM